MEAEENVDETDEEEEDSLWVEENSVEEGRGEERLSQPKR